MSTSTLVIAPTYAGKYFVNSDGEVFSKTKRKLACSTNSLGYIQLFTYEDGRFVKAHLVHRLVFEAFVGPIADGFEIDHIDRDRKNNSLSNLRMVTHKQNCYNNASVGVCWHAATGRWQASVRINDKAKNKYFKNKDEAIAWRANMKRIHNSLLPIPEIF